MAFDHSSRAVYPAPTPGALLSGRYVTLRAGPTGRPDIVLRTDRMQLGNRIQYRAGIRAHHPPTGLHDVVSAFTLPVFGRGL